PQIFTLSLHDALPILSFANPFFDEISKYPGRFATPVFFGESPYASYAAGLSNGTASLVKLQNRFLAVTCQHVLQVYRRARMNRGDRKSTRLNSSHVAI